MIYLLTLVAPATCNWDVWKQFLQESR